MAASPIAYTPHSVLPKEMTARDVAHLVKVFALAAKAAAALKSQGFAKVVSLSGGLGAWQQAGLPVEK